MTEKLRGLDFFGASRIAAGTDRRIRYTGGDIKLHTSKNWSEYVSPDQGGRGLLDSEGNYWWPSFGQQKEKVWEVEPEKQEEIIVWCWCDEDGISRLCDQEPLSLGGQGFRAAGESILELSKGRTAIMQENNLFSKDKLQKYRLVPFDQPLWPWKKFDPVDMPKEEFKFLALMEDGEILTDRWCLYNSGWATISSKDERIEYYCHTSKIPIPEQK